MESQASLLSDADAVLNLEPHAQKKRKTSMLKVALLLTNLALVCVVAAFVVREAGRSEALFANLDTNGDGKLDLKTELMGRLDASDSDKNGAIDAQEWEALKTAHRRQAQYRVKLGSDFGALIFDPPVLSIRVGDQVKFVNNAGFPHNVILDEDQLPDGINAYSTEYEALMREDYLNAPGEWFQVTYTRPGVYHYYCEPHQGAGMTGQIIVNP